MLSEELLKIFDIQAVDVVPVVSDEIMNSSTDSSSALSPSYASRASASNFSSSTDTEGIFVDLFDNPKTQSAWSQEPPEDDAATVRTI